MTNYSKILEIAKKKAKIESEVKALGHGYDDLIEIVTRCVINDVDVSPYLDQGFSSSQLNEIVSGLISNVDVSLYAKKEFNEEKMGQIRIGLENNVDVSLYAKRRFGHKQMLNIRIALMQGKDPQDIFELN